jgi:hypothetical protein
LGNAQIKVETGWVHFSLRLQMLVGQVKTKNPQKRHPASKKQGEPLSLLPTMSEHLSGILGPILL